MASYRSLCIRALFLALISISLSAHAGMYSLNFSGFVSDVTNSNDLVGLGDPVTGALRIDTDAYNWYGDDPNWGAYEAAVEITYGKVAVNSMLALYIDVKGNQLFGVARVPIDEAAMVYTDFRFWVDLYDVGSSSLPRVFSTMATRGAAALLTFDRDTEIISYAGDVKITVLPVPEPSTSLMALVGLSILCVGRKKGLVSKQ